MHIQRDKYGLAGNVSLVNQRAGVACWWVLRLLVQGEVTAVLCCTMRHGRPICVS